MGRCWPRPVTPPYRKQPTTYRQQRKGLRHRLELVGGVSIDVERPTVGALPQRIHRHHARMIEPARDFGLEQEAFATVAFSWTAVALVGALPYLFAGVVQYPAEALFESMSGFTTTGSTVIR